MSIRPIASRSANADTRLVSHAVEIRDLRPDETQFPQEMLCAALAWQPDAELPPREWVLEHPQAALSNTAWAREGDSLELA
jgi:hypothetical protein